MSRANESKSPNQPKLEDLMARYLERQTEARAAGLEPVEQGEVVPFEAAPVQVVEPQVAFTEALAVLECFDQEPRKFKAPPDWSALVAGQEPTTALCFAVGNFPQLVRHLQPLLHDGPLSELQSASTRPVHAPGLVEWAEKTVESRQFPESLLAIGALRLARQFELAQNLMSKVEAVPAEWQSAWANESAALAWHQGQTEAAAKLWASQSESVPVLFNRGMAALFLDRPADAQANLTAAIAQLPDTSAWHHLGRLYLTLAEMRA